MAITDIPEGRRVVHYDVKTAKGKAELASFKATETDVVNARLDGVKKSNAALDSMVSRYTAVGAAADKAGQKSKAAADSVSLSEKAIGLVGGKVKEFGQSIIGGVVQGLGIGLIGNVGSLVQQLFEPPTDAELQQMARATGELTLFEEANKRIAITLIEKRKETAYAAQALEDYRKTIESITHEGEIGALERQLQLVNAELLLTGGASDVAQQAYAKLTKQIRALKGEADLLGKTVGGLTGGAGAGGAGGAKRGGGRPKAAPGFGPASSAWWDVGNDLEADERRLAAQEADERRAALEADRGTRDFYARAEGPRAGVDVVGKQTTWLQRTFGPIEEFEVYQTALSTFADSLGSAYDAMVDGTMKGGAAVQMVAKQTIQAAGKRAQIEAVMELGAAFAALGRWDLAGAASHFKSAAIYQGAAIVAGAGASALGGGGGAGGAPAAGAAPSGTGADATGQPANVTHMHFYADQFANKSYIDRQRDAEAEARDANGGGYGVSQ